MKVQNKEVFGLFQGNQTKRAEIFHIGGSEDLTFWQLTAKDDKSICLEKEGTLYRICASYQSKQLLLMIAGGNVQQSLDNLVNSGIEALNRNPDKRVLGDANIWYLCGKGEDYQRLIEHNKAISENADLHKKQEEKKKADLKAIKEKEDQAKFDKENPHLSEYKTYLQGSGKTSRGVGSTIKALLKLNNIDGTVASRANNLLKLNSVYLRVDADKMRFYINEDNHFYDIQTKAELGFALWIVENNYK